MAIQKVVNTKEKPLPILEEVGKLSERVRRRAFDLFEQRGHELGRPLDDWLKRNGDSGLAGRGNGEKGGQYQLQLTLPGSLQRGVPGLGAPRAYAPCPGPGKRSKKTPCQDEAENG